MNQRARSEIQQAQARFAQRWEAFHSLRRQSSINSFQAMFQVIQEYEILTACLYRARAELKPTDPLRLRLEEYVSDVSQEILRLRREEKKGSAYREWVTRYRRLWRQNLSLFLFTFFAFVASLFIGWYVTKTHPDYIAAFVPQPMIESILEKHRWFDRIQMSPLIDGMMIAVNNIKVGLFTFVLGAFFGIGGLYILIFNGAMVGALTAFCALNHFDDELNRFVVGHGPLELSIIVAAAFSSFLFGRVFFMRPYRLFRKRLALAARDAGTVLSGILPWLLLAACLEVFVSPWNYLEFSQKMIVGVIAAVIFWTWTFFPLPNEPKASVKD